MTCLQPDINNKSAMHLIIFVLIETLPTLKGRCNLVNRKFLITCLKLV